MPSYPFRQVDAFTTTPLGGNPCAIIFDADDLGDETRLAIAREMNLSETSFVVRSDIADFGTRYFTPAEEIPLAGHPTIATVFALIDAGRLKLTGDLTTISLELRVGPIRVDIEAQNGGVQAGTARAQRSITLDAHEATMTTPDDDDYATQDLRRFLATAEERADTYKALSERLLRKLSRILDAACENDPGRLKHTVQKQVEDLHEGWYYSDDPRDGGSVASRGNPDNEAG